MEHRTNIELGDGDRISGEHIRGPTAAEPTQDLFSHRLYAGQTGSGKSVTVGEHIREFLERNPEGRVIDVMSGVIHDRPALSDEYETSVTADDLGLGDRLDEHVENNSYTRLEAEATGGERGRRRARHCFERAAAVAKESDRKVVVVLDDLPRGRDTEGIAWDEHLAKSRSYGVAFWVVDLEPFRAGLAEPWGHLGEIVLHSRPLDARAARAANLSDGELDHVLQDVISYGGPNQVLIGTPGNWSKETVRMGD